MSFSLVTERLQLTELNGVDGDFVLRLFTDPDCLRFIGDRGIKDLKTANTYLQERLIQSYRCHGFGLYKMALKNTVEPIGVCGLVKRNETDPPDLGFALLPEHRSGGYCTEACLAVLAWARQHHTSDEILAYTNPDNLASVRVLEKVGFKQQHITTLPGQDFESMVLSINLDS